MPLFIKTNRILISQTLLGFYLLGVCQSPVLNMLHIVSHLVIDHEHGGIHSFEDHAGYSSHFVLSIVDGLDSENEDQVLIVKTPSNKIEFLDVKVLSPFKFLTFKASIPFFSNEYRVIIQDVPAPPPKHIC